MNEFLKELDKIYPPNVFSTEVEYGVRELERGKAELTHIRRLTNEEREILGNIDIIIFNLKKKNEKRKLHYQKHPTDRFLYL